MDVTTLLKAGGMLLACCAGWAVLSAAVLDLMIWVEAPREARRAEQPARRGWAASPRSSSRP